MLRRGLSIHSFDSNLSLTTLAGYQDEIDINEYEVKQLESGVFTLMHPEQDVEVELLLSGSQVKDYHCSCSRFSSEGFCEHSLSLLFKVQNLKKQRKVNQSPLSTDKPFPKYPIQEILSTITFEDLSKFILEYSSQNREFALSFRAAFALSSGKSSNETNPSLLVDSILKHIHSIGKTWTKKKADKLSSFIEKYIVHTRRLLAESNFQLAYTLIESLARPILPICYKHIQNESLNIISIEIHKLITALHHANNKSPEVGDHLKELLAEIALSNWYLPQNKEQCVYLMCSDQKINAYLESIQLKIIQPGIGRETRSILFTGLMYFNSISNRQHSYPEDQWSLLQWNLMLQIVSEYNEWKHCFSEIAWVLYQYIPHSILPLAVQDLVKWVHDENQKYFSSNIAQALIVQPEFIGGLRLHKSVHVEVFDHMLLLAVNVIEFRHCATFAQHYQLDQHLLSKFTSLDNYHAKVGLLHGIPSTVIHSLLESLFNDTVTFLQHYFGGENVDKVIFLLEILSEKGMKDQAAQFAIDLLDEIPDRSLLKQKLKAFFTLQGKK